MLGQPNTFLAPVVGFIYGALAATLGQLMSGMGAGEQEYQLKMASIKGWMRAKDLTKGDQKKIVNYYRAKNKGNSIFDEVAILDELPPAMAGDISFYMYGRYVQVKSRHHLECSKICIPITGQ